VKAEEGFEGLYVVSIVEFCRSSPWIAIDVRLNPLQQNIHNGSNDVQESISTLEAFELK